VSESVSGTSSYGSVTVVLPLLEYLENQGFDRRTFLERVGIPKSALLDTQTRFPKRRFQALWQAASEATGDPAIALRVSAMVKPNTLGIIGYLALASESRRNAFELVKGLTPLLWEDVDCDLESGGEVAFIRCRTGSGPQASHFTTEYAIGLTVTMSRVLGAGHSDPLGSRVRGRIRANPSAPGSIRYRRGRGPVPDLDDGQLEPLRRRRSQAAIGTVRR
jgi:hypothetical protein